MSYTLVEPCCGSAAFSLHMIGAKRAIVPYQGSKWKLRRELQEVARVLGFIDRPMSLRLLDPGPWPTALRVVLHRQRREQLIYALEALDAEDAETAYRRLQGSPCPSRIVLYAAEFLFLQRLAFSGKAVDDAASRGSRRWVSPGFNKTSAYGTPATDKFGAVRPMVQSLIDVLRGYDESLEDVTVFASRRAGSPRPGPTRELVYIDPPYEGTTAYPAGTMARDRVRELALGWAATGAAVIVSETEPLDLPGWGRIRLSEVSGDAKPFTSKSEEWATFTREA